jgi:hypothetical protein
MKTESMKYLYWQPAVEVDDNDEWRFLHNKGIDSVEAQTESVWKMSEEPICVAMA